MGNPPRRSGECSDEARNVAILGLIEPTLPLVRKARRSDPSFGGLSPPVSARPSMVSRVYLRASDIVCPRVEKEWARRESSADSGGRVNRSIVTRHRPNSSKEF
jgi:hypothetical protein